MLIDIDSVDVVFGTEKVLNSVSACFHDSEFVGLIGPNGAGKTTLLRVILGLLQPGGGRVHRNPGYTIGYIPQHIRVSDSQLPISVTEVVNLGARGVHMKLTRALQAVKMADAAHKKFNELSGGQQQRVLIAKALAADPSILILDEPASGIDERAQTEFYDILRTLQKKGITILMVSHDIDTVVRLATRIIYLSHQVLYDGSPERFDLDAYMPRYYQAQHRLLHHRHEDLYA